jgi:hypothetical protein
VRKAQDCGWWHPLRSWLVPGPQQCREEEIVQVWDLHDGENLRHQSYLRLLHRADCCPLHQRRRIEVGAGNRGEGEADGLELRVRVSSPSREQQPLLKHLLKPGKREEWVGAAGVEAEVPQTPMPPQEVEEVEEGARGGQRLWPLSPDP